MKRIESSEEFNTSVDEMSMACENMPEHLAQKEWVEFCEERKMQKSNRNIKVTGVYPRKSPLYKWSDADDNIEPMSEDAVKLATAIDDHREYCFMVKQVIASMIERAEVELSKEAASFFTSDGFFEQLRLHVGNCSDSFQYENEYALFDFVDNLEAMVNDKRSNPNRLPAD